MARILKEKEHAEKRNDILDVTRRLVYTKGYEQMTIQDILDGVQISKGAFYHYFDSKQAVLEALIERITQEGLEIIAPIVEDPELPALEKFTRFFDVAGKWKADQKPFMLALMRVWYTDENALVRQKVVLYGVERISPFLSEIIQQGIAEKAFSPAYPGQVGIVAMSLVLSMSDAVALVMLNDSPNNLKLEQIECLIEVYTDAVERLLGTPTGSLHLVEMELMKRWMVEPDTVSGAGIDQT